MMSILREEWIRMEEQRMRALAAVTARTQERVDRWSRECAAIAEESNMEEEPTPRPVVNRRSASLKSPTSPTSEYLIPLPTSEPDLELGLSSEESESDDESLSSCGDGKDSDTDSGVDLGEYYTHHEVKLQPTWEVPTYQKQPQPPVSDTLHQAFDLEWSISL